MSLAEKCKRVSEARAQAAVELPSLRRSKSLDLRSYFPFRSKSTQSSSIGPAPPPPVRCRHSVGMLRPPSSASTDSDESPHSSKLKSRVKALSGRLRSAASSYSLSSSTSNLRASLSAKRQSLRRQASQTLRSPTSPAAPAFPGPSCSSFELKGPQRSAAGPDVEKELELCLRYVDALARTGKAALLPAALDPALELPLRLPAAAPASPRLAPYTAALLPLLQWADDIFLHRVLLDVPKDASDAPKEEPKDGATSGEQSQADLKELAALASALKAALADVLRPQSLSSADSGRATSESSLDTENNNAAKEPPPLPPRKGEVPRDSGVFEDSSVGLVEEPDEEAETMGIVEEPDSEDEDESALHAVPLDQRLFSEASMSNMLEGLDVSKGDVSADDSFKTAFGDAEAIEESEESKEESSEHKTTTEEVEEEDPSGAKKSRKVTSSRQVFSSSSSSSSMITSSSKSGGMDSLQKMLEEAGVKGKLAMGKDGDAFTVTETQQMRLGGRASTRTLLEKLDEDEWSGALASLPPPPPVPTDDVSVYETPKGASNGSANGGTKAMPAGGKVRKTEEVSMQKAASKTVNREARLNGQLVGRERRDALDAKSLDMTKASTFDAEGKLIDVSGGGTSDDVQLRRRHLEDLRGRDPDQPPPLPPRKHNVDTYIGVFRPPDASLSVASADGSKRAEMGTSALASYVVLRDRLCQHEEALKHKRTTFTFSNTAPNGQASASETSAEGTDSELALDTPGDVLAEFFEGGPGYLNLKKFWTQAQGMIQFPKKLAVAAPPPGVREVGAIEAGPEGPEELGKAEILGAVEASEYLLMRKAADGSAEEVRGGLPDALIVYATQPGKHILLYQEAFLMTYRTFVQPLHLVRRLVWRFAQLSVGAEEDVARRKAARNTFCLLVRVVHELGSPDVSPDLVQDLNGLVYRLLEEGNIALAKLLRSNLLPRLAALKPPPPQPLPSNAKLDPLTGLHDFKSSALAEQLTLLDSQLFQKIQPAEMLAWSREQSEAKAPNLVSFTEHFNRISFWVRSLVIRQADAKHRDSAATKFVKVMKHLRRLGNFNSYLAILSALDSGPLRRLDWGRGVAESLAEHAAIIDSSSSFRNYRSALAQTQPPCLPYIGLILQDLTFVHIGNPDRLTEQQTQGAGPDLLNFAKRWQQFTILDAVRRFKAWPYAIAKDDAVLTAFANFANPLDEDAIWELSETIKPRSSNRKPTATP